MKKYRLEWQLKESPYQGYEARKSDPRIRLLFFSNEKKARDYITELLKDSNNFNIELEETSSVILYRSIDKESQNAS